MSVVLDVLKTPLILLGALTYQCSRHCALWLSTWKTSTFLNWRSERGSSSKPQKAQCGEGPDINIDEMEFILFHIYHGAKIPWLSVAGSIMGVIKPVAHLEHVGESEVLIGTNGYIRELGGRGNSCPLRCSVIKVQEELVAMAGSLPHFPLTFNWTRKVTSKVFRAISTNCWTEAW